MSQSTIRNTPDRSRGAGDTPLRRGWLLLALLGAAIVFFVLLGGSPLAHAAERASGSTGSSGSTGTSVGTAPVAASAFDDVRLAATTGTISGNVKGSEGTTHPNLANIEVDLYSGDGGSFLNSTSTNNVGNFSLAGVEPGTYKLHIFGDSTHFEQWYNNKPSSATATSVTVTAGTTTTVNVVLTKSVGNISGKVTSATAAYPVEVSREVDLFSADGGSFVNSTTTDLNGN